MNNKEQLQNLKKIPELQSQLDNKAKELNTKIIEIAEKGTTVEVLEASIHEELQKKINDGTLASLSVGDGDITTNKTDFIFRNTKDGYRIKSQNITGLVLGIDNNSLSTMHYYINLTNTTKYVSYLFELRDGATYTFNVANNSMFRIGLVNEYNPVQGHPDNVGQKKYVDKPIVFNDTLKTYTFTNNQNFKYGILFTNNDGLKPNLEILEKINEYEELVDNDIMPNVLIPKKSIYNLEITSSDCEFIKQYSDLGNIKIKPVLKQGLILGVDNNVLSTMHYYYYINNKQNYYSYLFPIKENANYTINCTVNSRFRVGLVNNYNENVGEGSVNKILVDVPLLNDDTKTTYSFKNETNCKYCLVFLSNNGIEPNFEIIENIDGVADKSVLDNVYISKENIYDLSQETSIYKPINVKGYDGTESEKNINDLTLEELYLKWDNLVYKYNYHCNKTTLGKDTSDNYDIFKIDIKDKNPKYKIIITTGIHGGKSKPTTGDPRDSVLAVYEFFKDMLENWANSYELEWLLTNVHFIVLPMCNPYGFVNGKKGNINGVDINRNFITNWETTPENLGGANYKGNSPLSEKETQYISNVINLNLDAKCLLDVHCYGHLNSECKYSIYAIPNDTFGESAINTINRLNVNTKWGVTNAQETSNYSNTRNEAYSNGVSAITIEWNVYNDMFLTHSKIMINLMVKLYGNIILNYLEQL